jgi:hypothetical protein
MGTDLRSGNETKSVSLISEVGAQVLNFNLALS